MTDKLNSDKLPGREISPFFIHTIKVMEITVYTSPGCTWCLKIKELFARANVEYEEISYGDMTEEERAAFREQYPNVESFPAAVIDGEFVGGLVPVAKLFLQRGLVSAPQK